MEERFNSLESKLDKVLSTLDDLSNKVNDMWEFNNMDINKEFWPLTKSNSPITINALGQSILDQYECKMIVEALRSELFAQLESQNFKSPYDLQEYCERVLYYQSRTDVFLPLKNKIYFDPIWEGQRIDLKKITTLMGLYLRDEYLKVHPELEKEAQAV